VASTSVLNEVEKNNQKQSFKETDLKGQQDGCGQTIGWSRSTCRRRSPRHPRTSIFRHSMAV